MAQITARMFGGRTADKPKVHAGPGITHRIGASISGSLPLVLLAVGGIALVAPEPAPWWVRAVGGGSALVGSYLAGRAGYGVPGAESLLAHELTKLEARDRDLTRVLVGLALADVPAPRIVDRAGPEPAEGEPRPTPLVRGGGRPGIVRDTPFGEPAGRLDEPLDEGEGRG